MTERKLPHGETMHRILVVTLLTLMIGVVSHANPKKPDGINEILAVVNGDAITYQEIVGDIDLQAEINAARSLQGLPVLPTRRSKKSWFSSALSRSSCRSCWMPRPTAFSSRSPTRRCAQS